MFPSSSCRVGLVREPENHSFIGRRSWVWPGCIMPRGKPGVDYWETLALFGKSMTRCRAEPWDASEPFDDGVPELDKTPEAGGSIRSVARRAVSGQELCRDGPSP